ncbi:MAG: GNAT family N-acetyltransferase [Vicinamibacterales bacterium]|nr:GNAT family N-acetyltransferase [Vicinamibacterales bacterium]
MSGERPSLEWRTGWPVLADAAWWDGWEAARARAPRSHVFHRADVLRAWYDTVARTQQHEPVMIRYTAPAGARVYLAATVVPYQGRWAGRRVLEPAGQDLFGAHDPLVDGDADAVDWDAFWDAVRDAAVGVDQALFRFVPPSMSGRVRAEPAGDECPVLSLEGVPSLDAMLARCSANHRGDVRRRIRRAQEQGAVALQVFDPSTATQAMAEFDGAFWPVWSAASAEHGWGLHTRPGLAAFCQRVVREGVAGGWAHFAVLRVGDAPVAWHLGLADAGRVYWWLPVHDPAHDALAPGKLLLALLVARLIDDGWRELHFQTGAQAYKQAWQPAWPPLMAVRWHAPSARGRVLALHDRLGRHA